MKDKMPTLTHIVYTNDIVAPKDLETPLEASTNGVTVISFDDFVASGNTTAYPAIPPTPESTSVIMYTSGSTGKPKGVVITHSQCMASVASFEKVMPAREYECYIGYLP